MISCDDNAVDSKNHNIDHIIYDEVITKYGSPYNTSHGDSNSVVIVDDFYVYSYDTVSKRMLWCNFIVDNEHLHRDRYSYDTLSWGYESRIDKKYQDSTVYNLSEEIVSTPLITPRYKNEYLLDVSSLYKYPLVLHLNNYIYKTSWQYINSHIIHQFLHQRNGRFYVTIGSIYNDSSSKVPSSIWMAYIYDNDPGSSNEELSMSSIILNNSPEHYKASWGGVYVPISELESKIGYILYPILDKSNLSLRHEGRY